MSTYVDKDFSATIPIIDRNTGEILNSPNKNLCLNKEWYLYKDVNSEIYTPNKPPKTRFKNINKLDDPISELMSDRSNSWTSNRCLIDGIIEQTNMTVTDNVQVEVPPGLYLPFNSPYTYPYCGLTKIDNRSDTFLKLNTSEIDKEVDLFLNNEKIYRDLNIIYKRGILIYGLPGNSKSSTIRKIIDSLISRGAICMFFPNDPPCETLLRAFQTTLKDTLKVFIFEELSSCMKYEDKTQQLLNFLDGELSVDKSISIATTNYPERIPGNLVDRPSRFDKVILFDNPDKESREELIRFFLGQEPTESMIKKCDGFSIAAIKELCLNVKLFETSFEQEVESHQKRLAVSKKAFTKGQEVGF